MMEFDKCTLKHLVGNVRLVVEAGKNIRKGFSAQYQNVVGMEKNCCYFSIIMI